MNEFLREQGQLSLILGLRLHWRQAGSPCRLALLQNKAAAKDGRGVCGAVSATSTEETRRAPYTHAELLSQVSPSKAGLY